MADHDDPVRYHHDETMPPIEPGTFGFGGLSRRTLLAGGGALALGALLAACGDDSTATTTTGATTTGAPTSANTIPGSTATPTTTSATTTTAASRPEAKTETLTIAVPSLQEANVDPHFATGGLIFPLRDAIGEFLYAQNLKGQFVPSLATGYTLSDDKLKWTFKLRAGVKHHDGTEFTATDIKTSIDRILQGADFTHLANFKAQVTGANVIDPQTVEILTKTPYATLVVDMPMPISTEYFKKVGDAEFRKKPVACGPWKFVSQELNQNVKYERHDAYFDPARRPNWKKLVYAIVPEESARVAGLKTGTIDIAFGLTATTADGFKGESNFKINEVPNTGTGYCMMYDNNYPDQPSPLKDQKVRMALMMAIDRAAIAKTLYKGYARVPTSNFPTITPGFNPDRKAVPYDPDGAKKLLAEAGQSNLSITLNTYTATSTVPDIQKLAETIIAFWGQIGVKATLSAVEAATFLPQWRAKNVIKGAAMIAGPSSFYVEPIRMLGNSFFSSRAPYTTITGDKKIDDLVDQINAEMDATKRAALGRQAVDYLDDQLFGLPIVTVSSLVVSGPNVVSFATIEANPYAGPTSWIVAK